MIGFFRRSIRSYQGRHFTSRWVRKLFEETTGKIRVGYTIALFSIAVVCFEPTTSVLASEQTVPIPPNEILNAQEITTEHTVNWPIKYPRMTQGYHLGHYGIDLQEKTDLSIYPVDEGTVVKVIDSRVGYGKHLYIDHGDTRSSLYAHLASISVTEGQQVSRDTVVGIMGKTGRASGVHLHLEIYQNGKVVNPISLLPALSTKLASAQN